MKTQFTPPLANILLTIVGVMLLFSLKTEAQSAVYDPNYNESSFSFSCATDYIKLNTDVCMYNSSYRVMAFVNDNAGTNGDELLLTVIDWNSNMYQFPITPYDVNNNFVSAVTANTSYLWNPDVVIMENSSFTDGVQAIIVFDTDDPNYGAMVISFDVDLVNTPGISFNGGIAEPINFDGSVYDFSSQPKIDGDHQIHEFGIVSIQPYSTSSAAMVSYYGQSGPSYINNTYSILASIPVANYVPINPDIAVGDDINNPTSGLESVISYIDERIGYVHEVNVVRLPLGSTTPSLEYNNTLNSYTGAIGDNVNYPRICCEPHFDPTTTFPMEWSLTVSAMDLSNPPPSHLWSVHCDAPLVTNFIDDQTQNTYGLSENSMPALDWMDILSPNNMGDAFVAWRGIIHPPSLPDENGVYGMMNPYFTTYVNTPPNWDWYRINNYANNPVKNAVAVASDPDFGGYVVAWYENQSDVYYKVMAMNSTSFKPVEQSAMFSIKTKGKSIILYPNPVTEVLNIKSEKPVNAIRVYNMEGGLLMKEENLVGNEVQLKVNALKPGKYLINCSGTSVQFIKE